MANESNQTNLPSSPAPAEEGKKSRLIIITSLIVLVVLLALGLTAYRGSTRDDNDPTEDNSDDLSDELTPVADEASNNNIPAATAATTAIGTIREFTVSGQSFKFTPNEIRVKAGDTVRIIFQNTNGMHDWRLDEFNAATTVIQTGQTDTVEFVASRVGRFEFYCSVGQHRQLGMVGTLIVE